LRHENSRFEGIGNVRLLKEEGFYNGMTVGQLTSLNGFVPFPTDTLWNTDVSTVTADLNSDNIRILHNAWIEGSLTPGNGDRHCVGI
jgi:hypothetical protein